MVKINSNINKVFSYYLNQTESGKKSLDYLYQRGLSDKVIVDRSISYISALGETYKVSGDDFYYIDGFVTLPIGTITIQETKAPEGYLLEGAILSDNNGNTGNVDNGVYLTQIN